MMFMTATEKQTQIHTQDHLWSTVECPCCAVSVRGTHGSGTSDRLALTGTGLMWSAAPTPHGHYSKQITEGLEGEDMSNITTPT